MRFSRRSFLAGAAAARTSAAGSTSQRTLCACTEPAVVSVARNETSRRRLIYDALAALDDRILPVLALKKRVVIKPNIVNGTGWTGAYKPLAVTHPDALAGILDYLATRFTGPVTIAESSADDTTRNFQAYGYPQALREFTGLEFVDLNVEGRYQLLHVIDRNLHILPVRIASRLLDPEAFIICSAVMKTHNVVIATLSVKNMVMGAPLHAPGGSDPNSCKRKFHEGVRQSNHSMFVTAHRLAPFWGVAVIDGYEGMEGNGPTDGTRVASRIAIASTDFIAADRVAVECMGIDPATIGYLTYCGQGGLGEWDISRIQIRGFAPEAVKRNYALHSDIDAMRLWMNDLPASPQNPVIG